MDYLSVKEVAKLWDISERRVVSLCLGGKISGAQKVGRAWQIPALANKPDDGRYSFSRKTDKKTILIVAKPSPVVDELKQKLEDASYSAICLLHGQNGLNIMSRGQLYVAIAALGPRRFDGLAYILAGSAAENRRIFDAFMAAILQAKNFSAFSSAVLVTSHLAASQRKRLAEVAAMQRERALGVNAIVTSSESIRLEGNSAISFDDDLADDIFLSLTRHKGMTGQVVELGLGDIDLGPDQTSPVVEGLLLGKFFNKSISACQRGDRIWAVSMLMENEVSTDPLEVQFRDDNVYAAARGVELRRIFVLDKAKSTISDPDLKRYMLNKYVVGLCVTRQELEKSSKDLLKAIGSGFFGINQDMVFVDEEAVHGQSRGIISKNQKTIAKYLELFAHLEKMARPIKDCLL